MVGIWGLVFRIGLGLLLMIHGFAHYNLPTGWGSRTSANSWLLSGSGSATMTASLGNVLWVVTLLTFLASGVLVCFNNDWWRALAVAGSLVSLLTIGLFWQPNMVLGTFVDVVILVALLWPNSPVLEYLK